MRAIKPASSRSVIAIASPLFNCSPLRYARTPAQAVGVRFSRKVTGPREESPASLSPSQVSRIRARPCLGNSIRSSYLNFFPPCVVSGRIRPSGENRTLRKVVPIGLRMNGKCLRHESHLDQGRHTFLPKHIEDPVHDFP